MKLRPTVVFLTLVVPVVAPTLPRSSVWLRPLTALSPRAALAQPVDANAHLTSGDTYLKAANWDAAAREYEAVIALQPVSVDTLKAYVQRGIANRNRKQRKAALLDWLKAIDLELKVPDTPEEAVTVAKAYRYLGLAFLEVREHQRALRAFNSALKFSPRDVGALAGRGRAKSNLRDGGNPEDDFAAALQTDPQSADVLAARADFKRGRGTRGFNEVKARAALVDYDAALALDANHAPALFGRSEVRWSLATTEAERAQARADRDRAIALDPVNIQYYLARASQESGQLPGGPSQALADYGRVIELDPDNPQRYLSRAILQSLQPKPDETQLLADYGKVIGLTRAALKAPFNADDPIESAVDKELMRIDLIDGLGRRGDLLTRQNKPQDALTDFAEILALDKTHMRGLAGRGRILLRAGEKQRVIQDITPAMPKARAEGMAGPGFAVRGMAFAALGQWQEALVDLDDAIRRETWTDENGILQTPRDAQLFFDRGRAYDGLGHKDQARADYNIAVFLDPQYAAQLKGTPYEKGLKPVAPTKSAAVDSSETAPAWKLRGNEWRALGNKAKALEAYNEAIKTDPNYPDAYVNRGTMSSDVGRLDAALADYNKAVALSPQDARFLYNRGLLLVKMGKLTDATTDLQKAVALDPDDSVTVGGLGTAQQASGKFVEAEASFNRQLQLATTDEQKQTARIRLILVRAAQNTAATAEEMSFLQKLPAADLARVVDSATALVGLAPKSEALKELLKELGVVGRIWV